MSKSKKTKDKPSQDIRSQLESELLSLLDQGEAYSFKQIVKKLSLKKKDDIKIAGQVLDQLLEDEKIEQLDNETYKSKSNSNAEPVTGILDHVSSRFGYVKLGNDQP